MPIQDQNRIYDGWVSMEGGVDAGRAPVLIDPNMSFSGENMVFRGGRPTIRPGFRRMTEAFHPAQADQQCCYANGTYAPVYVPGQDSQTIYKTGIMQSVIGYQQHQGDDSLMAMIGGRLFKIIPLVNSCVVTEVAPIFDINSPFHTQTSRSLTDGVISDPPGLDILSSATAHFTSADVGARIYCSRYLNGVTTVRTFISSTRVRTRDQAITSHPPPPPGGNHFTVVNINPTTGYRNNKNLPIAYMVQADKWLIVQDGESKAILYDGSTIRRSDNNNSDRNKTEVPTGTIMAYGMGRVAVVVNERDVAFGDLYGSHASPDPGDSLILFTERNFLAEGFDAAIPFTMGRATGMSFFPQLDTSTGTGPLLCFAERGASSFDLTLDRTTWGSTSGFQTVALITTGLRGHRSIAVAGEDLWFRAEDGYRNYRQARSEPIGWTHIPESTNVRQFLDNDFSEMLKFASSVFFDNRVIGTCSPVWNNGRPYHEGLVIVDFDILSSFGTKFKPAWDGHWTMGSQRVSGLPTIKISQIVTGQFAGVTRCFVFGLDTSVSPPENQLYELTMTDINDWDDQLIPWELVTRAFDFKQQGNTPFTENTLYDGDIWLSEIRESDVGILPVIPPP